MPRVTAVAMGGLAQRVEVEEMQESLGAVLLLRRAGIIAVDGELKDASVKEQAIASALSKELGGLPLALDQAGAYIEETGCSLHSYQQMYRFRRSTLLQRRGAVVSSHPEPVSTTWSLSFERVEQTNSLAAKILYSSSILAPDIIPEELIIQIMRQEQPRQEKEWEMNEEEEQQNLFQLQGEFDEALATLRAYSLLHRNPATKTLSIHRLVQAVQQNALDADTGCLWAKRIIVAVNALFPASDSVTSWELCRRYLPQALRCRDLILHYDFTIPEVADLLFRTARYLDVQGDYVLVETFHQQALIINERTLGSQHYYTGTTLYGLARACRAQGRYTEAEAYLQRALSIKEQTVGQTHRSTLVMRYNLARLYLDQGRNTEADVILQETLKQCEQNLGPEYILIGHILYNLASLSHTQGNSCKAEDLFRRALAFYKRTVSENDPSIATTLRALAALMEDQGKYAEARSLYQGALRICEQIWGLEHPSTQSIQKKYSSLLQVMGLHEEAK